MPSIVFAGDFEIGETISARQRQTIKDMLNPQGTLLEYTGDGIKRVGFAEYAGDNFQKAILVNDIGYASKILSFLREGINGVAKTYSMRECYSSACALPVMEGGIETVIDGELIQEAIDLLHGQDSEVVDGVRRIQPGSDFSRDPHYKKFTDLLREYVVPLQIEDQLKDYGLVPEEVKVFTEREMRNIAQARTSKRQRSPELNGLSWRSQGLIQENKTGRGIIHGQVVVSEKGVPTCRGIMLAWYEKLMMLGYRHITELARKEESGAVIEAHLLFEKMRSQLDQTRNLVLSGAYRFY